MGGFWCDPGKLVLTGIIFCRPYNLGSKTETFTWGNSGSYQSCSTVISASFKILGVSMGAR